MTNNYYQKEYKSIKIEEYKNLSEEGKKKRQKKAQQRYQNFT